MESMLASRNAQTVCWKRIHCCAVRAFLEAMPHFFDVWAQCRLTLQVHHANQTRWPPGLEISFYIVFFQATLLAPWNGHRLPTPWWRFPAPGASKFSSRSSRSSGSDGGAISMRAKQDHWQRLKASVAFPLSPNANKVKAG